MASPQTENGFVMIALDLFAAILTADLPNRDMIVLSEVLLQSYGPQKRRDVHLDPVTIEHYTGLHRNNGRAAIKSLVAAEILKQNEDGSHRFLKDYESWKPGGQPFADRLVGGLIRFAKSALSRFGIPIKKSKKVAIQPDIASASTTIQSDWPYNCKANSTRLGPTTVGQSNEIDMELGDRHEKRDATPAPATGSVPPLACGGARASEELRVENRKKCVPSARENAGARADGTDHEPFDSGQSDPAPPEIAGPGKDSPAALALEEWAMQFGTDRSMEAYSHWARESCALVPAQWVRLLLGHHVLGRSGANRKAIPYLSRILADWRNAGACELERPSLPGPSANGHAGPPLSKVAERDQRLNDLIDRACAALE